MPSLTKEDLAKFPEENPSPVLRITKEAKLLYANPASKPLLKHWKINQNNHTILEYLELAKKIYQEKKDHTIEIPIHKQIFTITFVPINKKDGYINLYCHDVTRERHADRMKSEFVSLASHQLRTPLTATRWLCERLLLSKTGTLNDKQLEIARHLRETSLRLINLVNDLLNISRLDTGRITINPEPTDLTRLVKSVVDELHPEANPKKQKIQLEVTTRVPKTIKLDPMLIREVLQNLISNAIKYTPETGTILIHITRKDKFVICSVADSGIGIPQSEQTKIFDKFYRASNVVNKDIQGTGLGLYIVREIIRNSGGKLWFDSQENRGSTFYFTLPRSGSKAKTGEVTLDIEST